MPANLTVDANLSSKSLASIISPLRSAIAENTRCPSCIPTPMPTLPSAFMAPLNLDVWGADSREPSPMPLIFSRSFDSSPPEEPASSPTPSHFSPSSPSESFASSTPVSKSDVSAVIFADRV